MRILGLICILVFGLIFSGCVDTNRVVSLENRVASIEMEHNRQLQYQKDLAALKKKVNKGPGISKAEYAEIRIEIQEIKEKLQFLEGKIETLRHTFDQYSQNDMAGISTAIDQMDQAISRNYEKVLELEKYMGFEPSKPGPIVDADTPEPTKPDEADTETQTYLKIKAMFDQGDFENSRIQFENFIQKYPKSSNADNARFWIATSYYKEKWFEKAILEFQVVIEKYPNSDKMADARLIQGYSFAELGENANARLILNELIKLHPESKQAGFAREKLKNLK